MVALHTYIYIVFLVNHIVIVQYTCIYIQIFIVIIIILLLFHYNDFNMNVENRNHVIVFFCRSLHRWNETYEWTTDKRRQNNIQKKKSSSANVVNKTKAIWKSMNNFKMWRIKHETKSDIRASSIRVYNNYTLLYCCFITWYLWTAGI